MAVATSSHEKTNAGKKPPKQTKYIFVTGGVLSGVGKGITAASLGALLKARGFSVTAQKCDQYLNVDAGTLNPSEHGEVFVTADGAETDLDLGHYERFLDTNLTQLSSLMTGRVMKEVIDRERSGGYLGKTVQVVPHVTGMIIEKIIECGKDSDIHIVEVGGTVGDIEGLHFIEAIRELELRIGRENFTHIHVVYVPYLNTSKEFKTKPAQHAILELRRIGLIPDIIAARSEYEMPIKLIEKLSMFGGVNPRGIVLLPNAKSIYQVPLTLEQAGIADYALEKLHLEATKPTLSNWKALLKKATATPEKSVTIGIVAKYLDNEDAYFSVTEALRSAAWQANVDLKYEWVNAEKLTKETVKTQLKSYDGILVPGGFGSRGIEGKILAADYAYTSKKPYLGLCLGLQMAVIAAARRAGLEDANSREFAPKGEHLVVDLMQAQQGKENTGGTMRLGSYPCVLTPGSLAAKVYKSKEVIERHRHRYEVNHAYSEDIQKGGLLLSGLSPDGSLVEMIEAKDHPYYIATQAHPEFLSRPMRPHPLFAGFMQAVSR